jgi:hypothetical protein
MVLVSKLVGKGPLERPQYRWSKNGFARNGVGGYGLYLFGPGYRPLTGYCNLDNELSGFILCWEFSD